jgi:hypothetical protein
VGAAGTGTANAGLPEAADGREPNLPGSGSADPMQGKIEQLKSLGDLKAQGILTEEEFQAQKNAILNG